MMEGMFCIRTSSSTANQSLSIWNITIIRRHLWWYNEDLCSCTAEVYSSSYSCRVDTKTL